MQNYHRYLTITRVEEKWGLYVTTVGYSKIKPRQPYPYLKGHPKTHRFTWNRGRILGDYYLVFISRGKGVFESGTTATPVEEGSGFFLFPGVWHRYRPDDKSGWEEYWIGFSGTYARMLMTAGFFDAEHPFVFVGLNDEMLAAFQRVIETVRKGVPGYHQVIAGDALQILSYVYQASAFREENNDESRFISKAKFLLQESLESNLSIPKIAARLTMSYSKFRKEFKTATGFSPHQYHLGLRLTKAKELLKSTNLTIGEISYQTGFESVFYFSRYFKKKHGVSPMHYREQVKGKK